MNQTERSQLRCEQEARVVIFTLKKFRIYLLSSNQFKLSTDHQELRHEIQRRDIHGSLVRFLESLPEYNFKV